MKNNPIKICSTSYLIPKNKSWNKVREITELSFSEYFDWINFFSESNENQTLFAIIFFQDLYDNFQKKREEEKFFKFFLKILKDRLISNRSRIVICISSFVNSNILNFNKKMNLDSFTYLKFLKNISKLEILYDHLIVVELDHFFAMRGYNSMFDERNWYFAHCRLSIKGLEELTKLVFRLCKKIITTPKKLLILDCDNTLWGGVVGEDGINSVLIGEDGVGKIYSNFQKEIKKLSQQGVLLALASKNNENDVIEVFKQKKMILSIKDFVTWRINWNDKYKNIIDMTKELNLGLESVVFWDDNPLERDHVRSMVKEVHTIEVPKSIYNWPNFIKASDLFSKFKLTKDDIEKKALYERKSLFDKEFSKTDNKKSYLKSIKLAPKKIKIDSSNILRAEQLANKTNQFNLTTKRYSQDEIMATIKINANLSFMVKLNDIYGDHGIVGLIVLKELEKKYLFIETFLMSCRVFGRYLESWMLSKIFELARQNKLKFIIGHYFETEKNIVVKNFYSSNNFKQLDNKISKKLNFSQNIKDKYYISNCSKKNIKFVDLYE